MSESLLSQPWQHEYDTESPLAGLGASRQQKRLQLRNAGFKAAAVPARKVTPKSLSSSDWAAVSAPSIVSDAENQSPSSNRRPSNINRRNSSGILREIGNATLTRPKKARPPLSSAKLFSPGNPNCDSEWTSEGMTSPPPTKSTIRPRCVKLRNKVTHKRRSVSGETAKYIEHLEMELAAAQQQLSAINSPTVTRQQSAKMRELDHETRQLQEELAEWEAKYEERVQEELDRHLHVESELRAQLRNLEQDAEEARYMVQELEAQLDHANESLDVTETANVNLEKRLEIMSELLAASPTKINLHADTPGRRRGHVRPQSLLPRFPTAGSLMASPERLPQTQPPSPLFGFEGLHARLPESRSHPRLDYTSNSDCASDAGSVFSEAPITAESMTTADPSLQSAHPALELWQTQSHAAARGRPARRMRRFGAGSVGPKLLILPSTSHCERIPASAPPLERSETMPAFSFIDSRDVDEEDSLSTSRRRASTTADEVTLAHLEASPFLDIPSPRGEVGEESLLSLGPPGSAVSKATTKTYSSLGSVAGRNLMEELCQARTSETEMSGEPDSSNPSGSPSLPEETNDTEPLADTDNSILHSPDQIALSLTQVSQTFIHAHTSSSHTTPRSHSPGTSRPPGLHSLSTLDRIRALFSDLYHSPLTLARQLIGTAQTHVRLPSPLLNVQWWLVGLLYGPTKRRFLRPREAKCCDDPESQLLLPSSGTMRAGKVGDAGLAYGALYRTPPTSSPAHSARKASSMAGKGKKRACRHADGGCVHGFAKHSPWLWLKFSITLAFAVGAAFKSGPGSLLGNGACACGKGECDGASARAGSIMG